MARAVHPSPLPELVRSARRSQANKRGASLAPQTPRVPGEIQSEGHCWSPKNPVRGAYRREESIVEPLLFQEDLDWFLRINGTRLDQ